MIVPIVPSSTTNEFVLDTPWDNIENVFSTFQNLFEVSTTKFKEFDKFMSDTGPLPNVSTIQNPSFVMISAPPIITNVVQGKGTTLQRLVTCPKDDSILPP